MLGLVCTAAKFNQFKYCAFVSLVKQFYAVIFTGLMHNVNTDLSQKSQNVFPDQAESLLSIILRVASTDNIPFTERLCPCADKTASVTQPYQCLKV